MTDRELLIRKATVGFSNADRVGPDARHHLRFLLRYYAKKAHPFRACVRDNEKRFGDRANQVCAVLKDIIRGTTYWRGHPAADEGTPGIVGLSDEPTIPLLSEDLAAFLEGLDTEHLEDLCATLDRGE